MDNINVLVKELNTVNTGISALKYILKTNEQANKSKSFRRLLLCELNESILQRRMLCTSLDIKEVGDFDYVNDDLSIYNGEHLFKI